MSPNDTSDMPIPLGDLMLCWTPGGDVMAVRWPDRRGVANHLHRSALACCEGWATMEDHERQDKIWVTVAQITCRDGVAVHKVRRELARCSGIVMEQLA